MVRDIKTVKAWGRTREKLEAFAEEMTAKIGVQVEPVKTAREAVEGLDIVITMTGAAQPVLEGTWVSPGTHLNVTGSNNITRREVDGETIARSGIVAVEDLAQAKIESGDLKLAVDERKFQWEKMVTIGEIVAGKIPGRNDDKEITLFDSLGIGLWDAVAARFVYDKAVAEHVGIEVPVEDPPVKVRQDRTGR
jgi:ornithine cyclodeaminase/alanine dehydrogenase-like protein (mu-crystallin family)